MNIQIPEELISSQLSEQIVTIVLKEIDKRLELLTRTIELPPYPNRREVKDVLRIGDERLDGWISEGLQIQVWGKDHRIEREVLKEFLRTHKQI